MIVDPQLGRYRPWKRSGSSLPTGPTKLRSWSAIHDAHAGLLHAWLSGASRRLDASDSVLDRIELEYGNIRAALVCSIESRFAGAAAHSSSASGWPGISKIASRTHVSSAMVPSPLRPRPTVRPGRVRSPPLARRAPERGRRLPFGDPFEAETVARQRQDQVTEGRCRFTQGYGAPFDGSALVAAYELGLGASAPLLAGAAAAAMASGGVDDQRDAWLQRADGVVGGLDNSTIKANYYLAMADSLMERGPMQEALDLAVTSALDPRVMPTTRMLGIGRALQVAMYRADLGAEATRRPDDRRAGARVAGGGLLADLVMDGLRRSSADVVSVATGRERRRWRPEDLRRLTRLAVTPSVVRSVCRAAIQAGRRPDALAAAHVAPRRRVPYGRQHRLDRSRHCRRRRATASLPGSAGRPLWEWRPKTSGASWPATAWRPSGAWPAATPTS